MTINVPGARRDLYFMSADLINFGTFATVSAAGLPPGRGVEYYTVGHRVGFFGHLRVV